MARARGGNTGLAVALVIFGCAFVISTLVAIIFYTKIEVAEASALTAERELAKYVSPAQVGPANDYLSNDGTMFGSMLSEIKQLQTDLGLANDQVTRLTAATNNMENAFAAKDTEMDEVVASLNAEREQYATIMLQRQEKIDDLLREKQALTQQIASLQQQVTALIENADAAAQQRIAELNDQVSDFQSQLQVAVEAAKDARVEYQQLAETLPKLPEPNTTLPDATVASVFGSGNDLFITLGRNDGIVLGMTFEVYDPQPLIRLNTQGDARGKATIEVYNLTDDTATCRVVRIDNNEKIEPGDPIVNIGYDPNMDVKMYAFGYFDIDGDGGENDIRRIETLILGTTAELTKLSRDDQGNPILTPDIDYIVLGEKPELPAAPAEGDFDPEAFQIYQRQLAEYESYFRILDDAKLLRIPVLNQNRFLQLSGYYIR